MVQRICNWSVYTYPPAHVCSVAFWLAAAAPMRRPKNRMSISMHPQAEERAQECLDYFHWCAQGLSVMFCYFKPLTHHCCASATASLQTFRAITLSASVVHHGAGGMPAYRSCHRLQHLIVFCSFGIAVCCAITPCMPFALYHAPDVFACRMNDEPRRKELMGNHTEYVA
jgi:hypothetical protein